MYIKKATRRKMKSTSFGLPKEEKYPINTKRRAISAVSYAKINARNGKLTPSERDRILRKVHKRYPDIQIEATRGFKM